MYRKGHLVEEFEFDSKSFNNLYYAFMHRHNANVLSPEEAVLHDFKMFTRYQIDEWISNMPPVKDLRIISAYDFLSEREWDVAKKNRYLRNMAR